MPLEDALRGRQLLALAAECLTERAPNTLERALDHVMRVFTGDCHVNRGVKRIGERSEEVGHEFRRQAAYSLASEASRKLRKGASGQVDGNLCLGFVHGQ